MQEILDDPVNHPKHYADGSIEVICYLQDKLTPEEYRGFCRGNALKYISRAGKKGSAKEDYQKAIWYLNRLVDEYTDTAMSEPSPVLRVDRNANPDIKWEGH